MEEDSQIHIILGWPFLASVRVMINVKREKIALKVGEEKVKFDVFKMAQQSPSMTSYFWVDVVEIYAKDVLSQVPKEPLKTLSIYDTKEVKATKKVKKKKGHLKKDTKEWRIKSAVKNMNFKNFSSSFRVSNKRAQVR